MMISIWKKPAFRAHGGLFSAFFLLAVAGLFTGAGAGQSEAAQKSGTPFFRVLKSDRVHVRKGPGRKYEIVLTYRSLGLPVEVTGVHEHWRRVRDSSGSEGWIYFRLLSALRMAVIAPWQKTKGTLTLHESATMTSAVIAKLEPNVKVLVSNCTGTACLVSVGGFKGWIEQKKLWGVYAGEKIN